MLIDNRGVTTTVCVTLGLVNAVVGVIVFKGSEVATKGRVSGRVEELVDVVASLNVTGPITTCSLTRLRSVWVC